MPHWVANISDDAIHGCPSSTGSLEEINLPGVLQMCIPTSSTNWLHVLLIARGGHDVYTNDAFYPFRYPIDYFKSIQIKGCLMIQTIGRLT